MHHCSGFPEVRSRRSDVVDEGARASRRGAAERESWRGFMISSHKSGATLTHEARCGLAYSGANVTLLSEVFKFPLLG